MREDLVSFSLLSRLDIFVSATNLLVARFVRAGSLTSAKTRRCGATNVQRQEPSRGPEAAMAHLHHHKNSRIATRVRDVAQCTRELSQGQ